MQSRLLEIQSSFHSFSNKHMSVENEAEPAGALVPQQQNPMLIQLSRLRSVRLCRTNAAGMSWLGR